MLINVYTIYMQKKKNSKKKKNIKSDVDIPNFLPNSDGNLLPTTPPQRKFIKMLAKGKDFKKSYVKSEISSQQAYNIVKYPQVQVYLKAKLEEAGITDNKIFKRIKEGLDAKEQKEFLGAGGVIVKGEKKPDYEQRGKYIDRVLKLKGYLQQAEEGNATTINNNTLYQIVVKAREERGLPPLESENENKDKGV